MLNELVASVLNVKESSIDDASGRSTTDGWDSIAHLNIMAAVEETYDVLFSTAQMRELTTLGAIRASLLAQGRDA